MTTTLDPTPFTQQAEWCRKLGSPFTAAVQDALAAALDTTTATGTRVITWPGTAGPMKDVVPLRLSGALHALVLSNQAPNLAVLYPPNPMPDQTTLTQVIAETLKTHDTEIYDFITHAPQTNEVARSSLLIAGASIIAKRFGYPLALYEIGTSGGLNLGLDGFSHHLGTTTLGTPNSPVQLTPDWSGPAPTTIPTIISRAGCDLNPIDVTLPDQATRLTSYIWPDQPERLSRTRAAIKLTQANPPTLAKADAADWIETLTSQSAPANQTRVLMHSIAWQYMPDAVQSRITTAMETTGNSATTTTPLAWLAFEINSAGQAQLTLRSWPGTGIPEILATADPHVKSVEWH